MKQGGGSAMGIWQTHIMLVDDEPSIRAAIRKYMELSGFRISAFGDGHQAVRFFQEQSRSIELVLLDLIMPDISGPQVFHELKQTDPEVKVIFISGYNDSQTVRELLANDHARFLQKPFSFDTLLATISGILEPCETAVR
jgi:two-component system cell cycle sensor histidine kinase/response regulator CckA